MTPDLGGTTAPLGHACFVEPPAIFVRHTAQRQFIGPGTIMLPCGDILMAAPWGRPPTNIEELEATAPVPRLCRSRDNGRTWDDDGLMTMQWSVGGMISDGGISFLRLLDDRLMFTAHRHVRGLHGGGLPVVSYSGDDGVSWSDAAVTGTSEGVWYIMNERTIQTTSGRIIVPASHMPRGTGSFEGDRNIGLCLYSDDGGQSWRQSRRAAMLDDARGMAEPCVARMADGLLMLARTGSGWLYQSRSVDEGETWSDPSPTSLRSPCAPLTLKTLPDKRLIVFYNHAQPLRPGAFFPRTPLCYSVSGDGGEHWDPPVIIDDTGAEARDRQCIYPAACWTPEGMLLLWSVHAADPSGGFGDIGPELRRAGGGKRAIVAYPS